MKKNSDANAPKFLDIIYSSNLLPHITLLTRLTSSSHTLIDNIFSNINEEWISVNFSNKILDHLRQILVLPNCCFLNNSKKVIFQRNYKHLRKEKFTSDWKKINWGYRKQDVDLSYKKFFDKITKTLDIHARATK